MGAMKPAGDVLGVGLDQHTLERSVLVGWVPIDVARHWHTVVSLNDVLFSSRIRTAGAGCTPTLSPDPYHLHPKYRSVYVQS